MMVAETTKEEEYPIEILFVNSLEATISQENTKENKTSQTYKPSSLGCIRNMYYQRVGMLLGEVFGKADPSLVGMGETGTHRHEDLQSYITRMKQNNYPWEFVDVGEYIKTSNITNLDIVDKDGFETKLHNKDLIMSFKTDGLLRFKGERLLGLEIKTESSTKWYKREDVDVAHHEQAIAYALSLNLEEIIFLYENRDTCQKKAYLFKVTQKMKDDLVNKIKICEEHVTNKTLPPKTDNVRICYYCNYKNICKQDYNIDV